MADDSRFPNPLEHLPALPDWEDRERRLFEQSVEVRAASARLRTYARAVDPRP
jgi:hypothetical protein